MERLVRWFVERHLVVNIIVVVIVVLCVRSLTSAPRETFPNITMPVLFVGAALPGAAKSAAHGTICCSKSMCSAAVSPLVRIHSVAPSARSCSKKAVSAAMRNACIADRSL